MQGSVRSVRPPGGRLASRHSTRRGGEQQGQAPRLTRGVCWHAHHARGILWVASARILVQTLVQAALVAGALDKHGDGRVRGREAVGHAGHVEAPGVAQQAAGH